MKHEPFAVLLSPRAALLLPGLFFLSACNTSPDVEPFNRATTELGGAIKVTGRAVPEEIGRLAAAWPSAKATEAERVSKEFSRQWASREGLANALVEYSASIAAIVAAGEEGEKSAKQVGEALKKFCDAADLAFPAAGSAGGVVVDIGVSWYGKYAAHQAAKTLGASMSALQPAINQAADHLGASLEAVENILAELRVQMDIDRRNSAQRGMNLDTRVALIERLNKSRSDLLRQLAELGERRPDWTAPAAIPAPGSPEDADWQKHRAFVAALGEELGVIETSIAALSAEVAAQDAAAAEAFSRIDAQLRLVRAVRAGLAEWAVTHAQLAAFAAEKRPLQVAQLASLATEIDSLVKAIRH